MTYHNNLTPAALVLIHQTGVPVHLIFSYSPRPLFVLGTLWYCPTSSFPARCQLSTSLSLRMFHEMGKTWLLTWWNC
jgi:hypothetical protein